MPCPHFSREDNDCRLAEEHWEGEEERSVVTQDERAPRAWCLAPGDDYRRCPVFRAYVGELSR